MDEFLESIKKGVETPEKGRNAGEKLIPQGQADLVVVVGDVILGDVVGGRVPDAVVAENVA